MERRWHIVDRPLLLLVIALIIGAALCSCSLVASGCDEGCGGFIDAGAPITLDSGAG